MQSPPHRGAPYAVSPPHPAPLASPRYPENFRLDYALSREATNKKGGKMYIQDKVEEYSDEIFDRLDKGGHIYFCGLKGEWGVPFRTEFGVTSAQATSERASERANERTHTPLSVASSLGPTWRSTQLTPPNPHPHLERRHDAGHPGHAC